MKTAGYAGQPQNWGRLLNSSSNQSGGAMGVSWFGDHMTMGLSLDSYRNHYGTGLF
jgi:iron complex outermembrane receptor protein